MDLMGGALFVCACVLCNFWGMFFLLFCVVFFFSLDFSVNCPSIGDFLDSCSQQTLKFTEWTEFSSLNSSE